jgi:mannose-6-phosphate isomerase-like protein (cupin superfamily)
MPMMRQGDLAKRGEPTTADVLPNHVARYWDMVAYADRAPVTVIGETGLLRDKPGFEVQFMTRASCLNEAVSHDLPSVLMPVRGHWKISWGSGETTLAPGDTMSIPEGMHHTVTPSMTGEAALYRVRATQDPAGLTWTPKS